MYRHAPKISSKPITWLRKDFNIWHYPDKVNATSANSLEPAGASASADATLNWITPQHAGLALEALIDYKELIDFIPRIWVWGDFSGSKSNNWFRRSIYGMCERLRQFQSVDPIDNHNSWADTKCNNIDQFVYI